MKTEVNPIPKGYHSLTPYITVKDTRKALEFYKNAFGAVEIERYTMPDGSIGHAVIEIGDSRVMIADENLEWGNKGPQTLGGTPVSLCLYVKDVDAVFNNALRAGAKVIKDMVVKDQFYGDRAGTLTDPFGHQWSIMTHIEDVPPEEMQRRLNEMFKMSHQHS
jgi:PhnB protein